MSAPGVLGQYSWRWFQVRLFGLSGESRTWQKIGQQTQGQPEESSVADIDRELGISRE